MESAKTPRIWAECGTGSYHAVAIGRRRVYREAGLSQKEESLLAIRTSQKVVKHIIERIYQETSLKQHDTERLNIKG